MVVTSSLFVSIQFSKKKPNDNNINRVTKLKGGASNARQELSV